MKSKSSIVLASSAAVVFCAGIGVGALLFGRASQEATPFVKQSKPYTGDGSLAKELTGVYDSYNKASK